MRRTLATLLMFCFGLFSMELAVADVHDGDASAAEIAALTGADLQDVPADGSSEPTHDTHACHCVHGHGTVQVVTSRHEFVGGAETKAPHVVLLGPAAVDLDVHVRPPIART